MKALLCRMPVCPAMLHPLCPQGTRGVFELKPAISSRTFVLEGTRGECPGLALGGHRTGPYSQTSCAKIRHPGAHKAECKLRSLCTEDTPTSGSPSAQCSCTPSLISPRASSALLNITNSTIWRGSQKPKTSDRGVIRKRSPKPGSPKHFVRRVIFGERPGFEPYGDYLLSSPPLASCLISLAQFLPRCNGNSTSCEERL